MAVHMRPANAPHSHVGTAPMSGKVCAGSNMAPAPSLKAAMTMLGIQFAMPVRAENSGSNTGAACAPILDANMSATGTTPMIRMNVRV